MKPLCATKNPKLDSRPLQWRMKQSVTCRIQEEMKCLNTKNISIYVGGGFQDIGIQNCKTVGIVEMLFFVTLHLNSEFNMLLMLPVGKSITKRTIDHPKNWLAAKESKPGICKWSLMECVFPSTWVVSVSGHQGYGRKHPSHQSYDQYWHSLMSVSTGSLN